jgi:hypothetical protein
MATAYDALASLRKMLIAERQATLERIAEAKIEPPEGIGRAKALKWTIEKVSEQIKTLGDNTGDD